MDDALEFFLERAAILQFEGGMGGADAEFGAVALTRAYCARMVIGEPDHPYVYAMRGGRIEWSDESGCAKYLGPWVDPTDYRR